jgi:HAD superfamily hydrolase (TIGR01509 family)
MRAFGEEVKEFRADLYKKKYMKRVKPFPGMKRCLQQLHDAGVTLAVASSANPDEVEYYTGLLEIDELLSGSTSTGDAETSKPSPEIFQAALEQIGTDPERTLIVGDTPWDILAGHRGALPVAAVLSGGFDRELLTKAEFLFDGVEELMENLQVVDDYFKE